MGYDFKEDQRLPDIRHDLVKKAIWQGVSRDDAEDLVSDVLVKLLNRFSTQPPTNQEEAIRISVVALRNEIITHRQSPQRVLAKRLTWALSKGNQRETLALWKRERATIVGLREWQGREPLATSQVQEIGRNPDRFLFGTEGLAGANPNLVPTGDVAERWLRSIGSPLLYHDLLALLDKIITVPRRECQYEDGPEPGQEDLGQLRALQRPILRILLEALLEMPMSNRSTLVFCRDEEEIEALTEHLPPPGLVIAMPDWEPQDQLKELDLPWPDPEVAAALAIDIGAFHVKRTRTKASLQKKLGDIFREA